MNRTPHAVAAFAVAVCGGAAVLLARWMWRPKKQQSTSSKPIAEAEIDRTACVLLLLSQSPDDVPDQQLLDNFCGQVVHYNNKGENNRSRVNLAGKTVYVGGNLANMDAQLKEELQMAKQVSVVRQLTVGLQANDATTVYNLWPVVDQGCVPILVHGVAIYYRRILTLGHDDEEDNVFHRVVQEHNFQRLTESNKPGWAYRLGVYLTPVNPAPPPMQQHHDKENKDKSEQALEFNLLRCSTNFEGPTENFGATDWYLVGAVNRLAQTIFGGTCAAANHVLAQIYTNGRNETNNKSYKGTIARHSDKTKDMPQQGNGFIAFVSLYDQDVLKRLQPLPNDPFDFGIVKKYNGKRADKSTSGLTRMEFRLKDCVAEAQKDWPAAQKNVPKFTLTLYPNSVLLIPLSTNRLYTHEIKPSTLQVEDTPTRMGYVVRCSGRPAIFDSGKTFVKNSSTATWQEMLPPTPEGMKDLRTVYRQENMTCDRIDYGDRFPFSMNKGDYTRPKYRPQDEFPVYDISSCVQGGDGAYNSLFSSVAWEDVAEGRKGAVMIKPNASGKVPVVRTTTKYKTPAQTFSSAIRWLAHHIEESASLPFDLNNALMEHYTSEYGKMRLHSDQALDLKWGSHVAVYTCYKYPHLPPNRKIVIEPKQGGESFEIILRHNHVVVFSLDTNKRFRHKIVLTEPQHKVNGNEWIGVTFRTSKTFVEYSPDGQALLSDGQMLKVAREGPETKEFYMLRGKENRETDFSYPRGLAVTISNSDLMPPIQLTRED